MNRRNFLGLTSVSVLMTAMGSRGSAHQGDFFKIENDLLVVESGPGQLVKAEFAHHHHHLEIPLEYIQNPPGQGLKIRTSWAVFDHVLANIGRHYHTVFISQAQLAAIGSGESVVVEDTVKDHQYVLRLRY